MDGLWPCFPHFLELLGKLLQDALVFAGSISTFRLHDTCKDQTNPVAVLAMSIHHLGGVGDRKNPPALYPTRAIAQVVNKATLAALCSCFASDDLPQESTPLGPRPHGVKGFFLMKICWSSRSFARAKADLKHNDQLVDPARSFARDQSCVYFDSWHWQRCHFTIPKNTG